MIGNFHQRGGRLRRRHRDPQRVPGARRTIDPIAERSERREIAVVVAREGREPKVVVGQEIGERSALVDRDRRAQLGRHPARDHRQPVAPGKIVDLTGGRRVGRGGAPMHGEGSPALAFDKELRPTILSFRRGGDDCALVQRSARVVQDARPPSSRSSPYCPTTTMARSGTCRRTNSTGRPVTIATTAKRAASRLSVSTAPATGFSALGVIHDRSEGSIEVDGEQSRGRLIDKRRPNRVEGLAHALVDRDGRLLPEEDVTVRGSVETGGQRVRHCFHRGRDAETLQRGREDLGFFLVPGLALHPRTRAL